MRVEQMDNSAQRITKGNLKRFKNQKRAKGVASARKANKSGDMDETCMPDFLL